MNFFCTILGHKWSDVFTCQDMLCRSCLRCYEKNPEDIRINQTLEKHRDLFLSRHSLIDLQNQISNWGCEVSRSFCESMIYSMAAIEKLPVEERYTCSYCSHFRSECDCYAMVYYYGECDCSMALMQGYWNIE